MDYRDPGVWIDVVTEFFWNAASFVTAYTIGNGQLTIPTKSAWVGAGLAGVIGAANHIRALRRVINGKVVPT